MQKVYLMLKIQFQKGIYSPYKLDKFKTEN